MDLPPLATRASWLPAPKSRYLFRVFYPPTEHRLVLRTELDWNRDVEGVPEPWGASFELEAARPWLYFKPCLRTRKELIWLPGMNRVAEPRPEGRDIYPYFFSGERGTLTAPQTLDGVRFRVFLPPGYDENTLKSYPVLYMHDGANLFLPEEAFLGQSWEVDETLDTLHKLNVIDQVLVVGIHAGDRLRQFTSPGYGDFSNWCADVLRPEIDRRYRTLRSPQWTAVVGSSLGGVAALHQAWSRPEAFGMAGCLSSTFGVYDDLFQRIATESLPRIRVYLDSGWPQDNFERTLAMRDLLLRRGFAQGADLLYFAFPGATHHESAWRLRVHLPFQFFFARPPCLG